MRKLLQSVLVLCALLLACGVSGMAQEKMKDDKIMKDDQMMADGRPVVAIIRADWCPACKKIEPFMKELMKEYGGRLHFVVFDVTSETKVKESEMLAAKQGLSEFFKAYREKTSTVVVFDAKQKQLFQTDHNYDREAYVKAFDKALAKPMMKG
jgi:thiol-disulfide isomerase/thioredoxin